MSEINLSPQVLDLTLYAGDGVNFKLTVKDTLGAAVPLTGTMEAEIRIKRTDADPPVVAFTIDLSDSDNGIALLSLTGEQTQLLAPIKKFKGVWDLQWTPTGKEPRTLAQGKVVCLNDVSR